MTHEELLETPEYWATKMQLEICGRLNNFLKASNISYADFAKINNIPKNRVLNCLKAEANLKISELVEIVLAMGLTPSLNFSR